MRQNCPNYNECSLVKKEMDLAEEEYKYYLDMYCCCDSRSWSDCTRFRTKEKLNFCPDFVLPDSQMTIDDIIDRFDNENL